MGCTASLLHREHNPVGHGLPMSLDVTIPRSETSFFISSEEKRWLVRYPEGHSGPLYLHDGIHADSPVMVKVEKAQYGQFEVMLPILPKRKNSVEKINWESKQFKSDIYWFELELHTHTERFEWRKCAPQMVGGLDLDFVSSGWILVRAPKSKEKNNNTLKNLREMGRDSDGAQIVAMWGAKRVYSKLIHFEIRDPGRNFGQEFVLIALASALKLQLNILRAEDVLEAARMRQQQLASNGSLRL